jgi:hypothetical protein
MWERKIAKIHPHQYVIVVVRSEAVAFAAISMVYPDPFQHKVHFGPKSAFEEMQL